MAHYCPGAHTGPVTAVNQRHRDEANVTDIDRIPGPTNYRSYSRQHGGRDGRLTSAPGRREAVECSLGDDDDTRLP